MRLGLRAARLDPALVGAYTGPARLPAELAAGPPEDPASLAAEAEALRSRLPGEGLAPERAAWLDAQLSALGTALRRRAGERLGHLDLVEALYQVRPAPGDPDAYRSAHRALAALLPGAGPLSARYQAYTAATVVPPARLAVAARDVTRWLRLLTRRRFPLPAEEVDVETVVDRPWGALQTWHGTGRSRVALSADRPLPLGRLVQLLAHECYPGHHTERVRKEVALAGQAEAQLALSVGPECTLAEGLAELGLRGLGVVPGWGAGAQEVAAGLGLAYDGALAEAVARAVAVLAPVRQDAALLLHAQGAGEAQARAHLERWLLLPPERAARQVRYAAAYPAYSSTYTEGERLVAAWLDRAADERSAFARLLDGQLTPAALRSGHLGAGVSERRGGAGPP